MLGRLPKPSVSPLTKSADEEKLVNIRAMYPPVEIDPAKNEQKQTESPFIYKDHDKKTKADMLAATVGELVKGSTTGMHAPAPKQPRDPRESQESSGFS